MRDFFKSIGSGLALRFGNKKTAVLSALTLFALVFLVGSVLPARPPVVARDSAKESEPDARLPSAGGLPSQAPIGAADVVGSKTAEGRDDRGLYYTAYKVARGDTLSDIAETFNVTLDTVISFNGIRNARSLQPGRILKVPSMSGILYTAKSGDRAASVAAANGVSPERVAEVNGLAASEAIEQGRQIFVPDARLASFTLREISGDLFHWPARGWISSWYGWRRDPIAGVRSFHNGIDIGVDLGTPVCSAMDGVVSETGYNSGFGNYIIVSHHGGWMSLYGHLQTISVKEGARVSAGQRIAYSGNTGYSTGPHLHFSVFKNGRTVNPFNVLH
jgi:murein DD-endopeptidase MepM/ murein hydrolase activator NlpD